MNALSSRHHIAAALLCMPLLAGAAPAAPAVAAPITFDTTPRPGQHQLQKLDIQAAMKMRVEPGPDATPEEREKIAQGAQRLAEMGTMKLAMKMQQTVKVEQPDANGWLPMTFSTNSQGSTMEVGGKVVPLPQAAPDLSFVARFNPADFAFQIQQVSGAPEMSEFIRAKAESTVSEALQLFKTLKNRPLKVGESVDLPLNMALPMPMPGGAGSMAANVRYTLARVERGVAHFDLTLDLKMDIDAPVPTPPNAAASAPADAASAPAAPPQTLHITATGTGKGSSSLRLADRLPLSNQLTMDMQMNMRMPGNALMGIDMNMVMKSTGESLAKPAGAAPKAKPAKTKS